MAVLEAPDLIRQKATAVRQQELEVFQLVERTAEHELADHDRGVERIADEVGQVPAIEPAARTLRIRVREDDHLQFLQAAQYRPEFWVGEFFFADGGAHFHRLETVLLDDALELRDRGIRMLHGQCCHAAQPVGTRSDHFSEAVVDERGGFQRIVGAEPVKESLRPR